MFIEKLRLNQYRNILSLNIEPGRYLTILHGCNGHGKTNILESIYMLAYARSFKNAKLFDIINYNYKSSVVYGKVCSSDIKNEITLNIDKNVRRISINNKSVYNYDELYGTLSAVVFSPDDTAMIKLGPETRRRYLDRSLYTSNAGFLHDYHRYYRTLKQRNVILKNKKKDLIDVWTDQLADAAVTIMAYRKQQIHVLNSLLKQQYKTIVGISEDVSVEYQPDINDSFSENREGIISLLNKNIDDDLHYGTTRHGPHRDEIAFLLNNRPLKNFGSSGQQRSFILALKMAEMEHIQKKTGEMPVLLLDDIASELDRKRIASIISFLVEKKVQMFITTTDMDPFIKHVKNDSSVFMVENGKLTYEGNINK